MQSASYFNISRMSYIKHFVWIVAFFSLIKISPLRCNLIDNFPLLWGIGLKHETLAYDVTEKLQTEQHDSVTYSAWIISLLKLQMQFDDYILASLRDCFETVNVGLSILHQLWSLSNL